MSVISERSSQLDDQDWVDFATHFVAASMNVYREVSDDERDEIASGRTFTMLNASSYNSSSFLNFVVPLLSSPLSLRRRSK